MKPFVAFILHLWAAMDRNQEILRKSQPCNQLTTTPGGIVAATSSCYPLSQNLKNVLANLSALSTTIRAASCTIQELNDAIQAFRGIQCYYPPLRARPRPKPRRFRAKHQPTRLQRRMNRQTKRKRRK